MARAKEARALFHAGLEEQAKPGYNLSVLLSAGEEARVVLLRPFPSRAAPCHTV